METNSLTELESEFKNKAKTISKGLDRHIMSPHNKVKSEIQDKLGASTANYLCMFILLPITMGIFSYAILGAVIYGEEVFWESFSVFTHIILTYIVGAVVTTPLFIGMLKGERESYLSDLINKFLYMVNWYLFPVVILMVMYDSLTGRLNKLQQVWYEKQYIDYAFLKFSRPVTIDRSDRYRLKESVESILNSLNTEVEVNTDSEVGYMTYLHVLMMSDSEGIRPSTWDFKEGKQIKDLEFKKYLIEDEKLTEKGVYDLAVKLVKNRENQRQLEMLKTQEKVIEESEVRRQEMLEYIKGVGKDYHQSKQKGEKLRGNTVMKEKLENDKKDIKNSKLKLIKDLEEIKAG